MMRLAIVVVGLSGVIGCSGSLLTGAGEKDLSVPSLDGESGCRSNADCPGGACIGGDCCAPAGRVCNGVCCAQGSVCLFEGCVTPGKPCHTAGDCASGEYCETALGGSDGGTSTIDAGCVAPVPIEGRCLALPPRCPDNDGGVDAGSDGGCLPACEYHPPANGALDAVARWTWDSSNASFPEYTDVWATPTVGRIHDSNCDGVVNELDPPVMVFVSGKGIDANTGLGTCCQCSHTTPTSCHTGVLRMLDGRSGREVWSLAKPSPNSSGFAGLSTALGDLDGDGNADIAAVSGEGYVLLIDANGNVKRQSDKPIPGAGDGSFGWGGGLAIGDMDGDGHPEIAFGATVFTTINNAITLKFAGAGAAGGGGVSEYLSTLVDLDGDGKLELLAGATAYRGDGSPLWDRAGQLPDGFPGVGDFDRDGVPEVVLVSGGKVWILDGPTGATRLGPLALPGNGTGGPPTIADFDGNGRPEIGVAQMNRYSVLKADFANNSLSLVWTVPNHDYSSAVTGSTVFDFEGTGAADVIYADECWLWVYSGATGAVRLALPHTSFTGTEASLVADVDGDGRAEIVMVSNGADPSSNGWKCLDANGAPVSVNGVTWIPSSAPTKAYRGISVFGDRAYGWVGTRTLWSEHTYHVSNICDDRDSACMAPNVYGSIPMHETPNWTVPWLNNFRQNVQDHGLFDAPDATCSLSVECSDPVVAHPTVRNVGLASLPAGVPVAVYRQSMAGDVQVGMATTTRILFPGQLEPLTVTLDPQATHTDSFYAEIVVDPTHPTFHECRADNDRSDVVTAMCLQ